MFLHIISMYVIIRLNKCRYSDKMGVRNAHLDFSQCKRDPFRIAYDISVTGSLRYLEVSLYMCVNYDDEFRLFTILIFKRPPELLESSRIITAHH